MNKGTMRAGAQLLLMATDPINRGILRTVLEHPRELTPGRHYKVSDGGREMLFIAFVAERWLHSAPQGPIAFEGPDGESAIAALAEGWSTTVIHALAREPLSFRDLHRAVDGLNRRALKLRLAAMQNLGQIEVQRDGANDRYALTEWLRAGIAALMASARLERRNPMEGMAPIDELDVEAGLLLSLSLLELPAELTGVCRLGVNLEDDESGRLTGITARIEQGRVVSCEAGLDRDADAWAAGSAADWLDTVIDPDAKRVRTGGDQWLTRALLDSMHKALFGVPVA